MILLPTKWRPKNLQRFIDRYKATNATEKVVVITEIDDDSYKDIELPAHWISRKYSGGKGACSHFNKIFAEFPDEEYYGIMADDVVPETPEWDKILKENCLPDKIAYGDDGIDHSKNCNSKFFPTHPFIGGDLVRKWGFIVPHWANHFGADQWWFEGGEQVVLEHIALPHYHFSNRKAHYDKTYQTRPSSSDEKVKYIKFREEYKHLIKPYISVVCVKWGTLYNADYVNILQKNVEANLRLPHKFICYTDDATGLNKKIEVRKLPDNLKGWWNKLYLFSQEYESKVLYLDLDTILVGNIDKICNYNGEFAILRDFYRPDGYGSGVMMWKNGFGKHIWNQYVEEGYPEIEGGDQAFIEKAHPDADRLQTLFPGDFTSYKKHAREWPKKGSKVVCFHGTPKPHECKGWVRDFWKESGLSQIFFVQGELNTKQEHFISQTKESLKLNLPEIKERPINNRQCTLVGGAPSLKKTWPYIQGEVFAVNGTADYLRQKGIKIDYHIILDAREDNLQFVLKPSKDTHYLIASCCHPKIFEALKDYKVTIWHPFMDDTQHIFDKPDTLLVGGGNTVTMRLYYMVYLMGYRKIHFHGIDSSYDENENHAYKQSLNDGEQTIEVVAGGKAFKCAPWMAKQAQQFINQTKELSKDCEIDVFGEGLIPHVAKLMNELS